MSWAKSFSNVIYSSALPKIKHQQRSVIEKSSNEWWEQGAHEAHGDSF